MPGTFNGFSQLSLVFCARTRLATRPDLPFFADKALHHINLLVIDLRGRVSAKLADPRAGIIPPST
jgi:hypothetical protein